MSTVSKSDTLERTVEFLKKRDGIDKVLKLLRYAVKLSLVSALKDSDTPLATQLRNLENSVGTTRKALKLGKFLADIDKLRKLSTTRNRLWLLELLSGAGEAVYLFLEQITWLIKAGVVAKRFTPRVSRLSAWAELSSYAGSLTLSGFLLLASYHTEQALVAGLQRASQAEAGSEKEVKVIQAELMELKWKRTLRQLAVVQDISDAVLAINDLRDGKGRLSSPVLLSLLGLLSAAISAHKNWPRS